MTRPAEPVPTDPPTATAPPSLVRNRSYLLVMSGLTTEALGAGIAVFAVPLLALSLTGSVWEAGVVTAVGHLGALLATLPAGVVADRVDRRRLIVLTASIATLAWLSAGVAAATGQLTVWHLGGVLLVSSVAAAFVEPAVAGAFRSVVPQEQLAGAYAASQGRDAAAGLVAGPVGGLLYGIAHAVPLLAAAVGHLATAVCTWLVREPLNADTAEARRTHPVAALREGLRYVGSVPLFRLCIGLFAIINIAINGMFVAITLDLADGGTSAARIGLLSGVVGASMLIGAVLAPVLVKSVRVGVLTPAALALVAVAAVVMAANQSFWGYVVALGAGVLLVPAANAAMAGYSAAITPPRLQGRFSSVMDLSGTVAMPLAPLVGSGLLALLGIGPALVVLAALLAVTVVGVWCARPLRRIGRPDTWADDALPTP
ncbi:MFS transporter [Isoptericola croceus]|uniref:MFS transporter n=1 Tax=Isoptericola croceus TaxID=3031406 RepID=UPI0023F64CAA|nr:MFS transporter [Isoptericola croceus]